MRWVLLLLVAANVMLFTWFQFRGDPQGESRESVQDLPARRDGVATLELLSETDAAASALEEPTAAEAQPAIPKAVQVTPAAADAFCRLRSR